MKVNCIVCNTIFEVKPSRIKRGWGKYCSQECKYQGFKTGSYVKCSTCRKLVYKNIKDQGRSKSGKLFCGKSCQTIWRNSIYVGNKHINWKEGRSSYRQIMLRAKIIPVCARCEASDIRIMVVHHKDRNRKNNSISNLIWLCHNCHYVVHHYSNEAKNFLVPVA